MKHTENTRETKDLKYSQLVIEFTEDGCNVQHIFLGRTMIRRQFNSKAQGRLYYDFCVAIDN